MSTLGKRITPFILLGIGIIVFAFGILIFAYLFIFGSLIGLILYFISRIKENFFASKKKFKPTQQSKPGRIIDADDWRKLSR